MTTQQSPATISFTAIKLVRQDLIDVTNACAEAFKEQRITEEAYDELQSHAAVYAAYLADLDSGALEHAPIESVKAQLEIIKDHCSTISSILAESAEPL